MKVAAVLLAACAAAPAPRPVVVAEAPVAAKPKQIEPIPETHYQPKLAIDWAHTKVHSDEEALALWAKIAPTGADWDEKLPEIPGDQPVAKALALALLHGGNFACPAVITTHNCKKQAFDVEAPKPTEGFDAPCLRRLLALWAIDHLEPSDRPAVRDAYLAIAQLPPPESQLVSAVLQTLPPNDGDEQWLFLEAAWAAGQRELVNAHIGMLDESRLIAAVTRDHIDGALQVLSAEGYRSTFLAAVSDEKLDPKARIDAMNELVTSEDKLSFDVKSALIAATDSPDCGVAAAAARQLETRGIKTYLPTRPKLRNDKAMLRGLCVLASYEAGQKADESSLLPSYVPARGLTRVTVSYDPLSDVDTDGDGDPHTRHEAELVARKDVMLPDPSDMAAAFKHCKGTTCVSDDREYRFTFKAGELTQLEVAERPPCLDLTVPQR